VPLLEGEKVVCLGCALELPLTDFHQAANNDATARLAGRFRFERATAHLHFAEDSLTQHLIHLLKYGRRAGIGIALGEAFGEALREAGWMKGIDVIAPVPLHPKKEAARGFNQSSLLVEGMSGATGVPSEVRALRRIRYTESQTHKTRAERIENVAGAFVVRRPGKLEGRHVLLVDDVLTTGATIEACAQAVLAVPGTRISVATLAIAGG
jgi:ComF family protein